MPSVITKFNLETTDFDSKLRKCIDYLKEVATNASNAGNAFNGVSDKAQTVAENFGKIATGANNAKDELKLLVTQFNALANVYNTLPKKVQESDFGKAIASGLQDLKGRIADAKKELYDAGNAMEKTGGASSQLSGFLDQLAGKFGINIGQLTKFGGAMTLVSGAVKVGVDAFKMSASNLDEWDRTVAGAKAGYETFLYALNSGDFSGFFSRINEAISKAREAADAINNLELNSGVRNTDRLRIQAQQTKLRAIIKREGAGSAAGQAAQQQLLALEPLLGGAYRRESGENWIAAQKLIEGKLQDAGLTGQISAGDAMRLFYDENALARYRRGAAGSIEARQQGMQAGYAGSNDKRNINQKVLDALFTEAVQAEIQPYIRAAFSSLNSSYGVGLGNNSYLKTPAAGGTPKVSGGGGTPNVAKTEEQLNSERIRQLTEEYITAAEERREAIRAEIKVLQQRNDEIQKLRNEATGKVVKINVDTVVPNQDKIGKDLTEQLSNKILSPLLSTDTGLGHVTELGMLEESLKRLTEAQEEFGGESSVVWQAYQKRIDAVQKQINEFQGKGKGDGSGDALGKVTATGGKVVSSLSSIASGVEQLGIDVPEGISKGLGVLQGIITILSAINSILLLIGVTNTVKSVPIIGWFAAHGGIAHAAGGYTVPGNMMSGDQVPAMLNSGELVLNRAQQGNIASQLSAASNLRNMDLTATISGEQIRLALNNNSRRRGRGEYVTSKTIR